MYAPSLVASLLLALTTVVTCVPRSTPCKAPKVRKEWRTLSLGERDDFIAAVQCMKASPSKTTQWSGSVSRYDDYQALHINQTGNAHYIGSFLAWHRNFIALFENDLKTTCDYNGALPYWNWTIDAPDMLASPLFDTEHGFGGNGIWIANTTGFPASWQIPVDIPGRSGGGCITDGPFVNWNVSMGPGNSTTYTPHCLHRDFSPYLLSFTGNKTKLDWVLEAEDFWTLDHRIEGVALGVPNMSLHAAGHQSIGGNIGEMTNVFSSPGDPLFFMHHSMLDNVWSVWQHADWAKRKTDIGGPDVMYGYPYNYTTGDLPYKNITLATTIAFPELAPTIPIADVMDTKGGFLCYTYDDI